MKIETSVKHFKSGIIQIIVYVKYEDFYKITCDTKGCLQLFFDKRLVMFNSSIGTDRKEHFQVSSMHEGKCHLFQLTPYSLLDKVDFKQV